MITLARNGVTLDLSDRLIWTDEYAWSPVATEVRWGTTGAVQIHVGTRQAGRPITLEGRDTKAWITRAVCDQLNAWAALPGAAFELTLRGAALRAGGTSAVAAGTAFAPGVPAPAALAAAGSS